VLLYGLWLMWRVADAAALRVWALAAKALTATALLSCCLRVLGPTQLRGAKGWAAWRCAEVLHCLTVCMLAAWFSKGLLM